MIEFIQNIWTWIDINLPYLTSLFSSTTFAGVITMIVIICKNITSTNKNTLSINSIQDSFKNVNNLESDVKTLKDNSESLTKRVEVYNERVANLTNNVDVFIQDYSAKVDAILEVQRIVYSTIKDDTIRNSVNSILVDAAHSSTKVKMELQKELEDLKKNIKDTVDPVTAVVNDTIDKAENVVGKIENDDSYTRY